MGKLINGIWTSDDQVALKSRTEYIRAETQFRNWITTDGQPGISGEGGFAAESGRYHLYVSDACPWAHRTIIFRQLKDLQDHISVSVVNPDMFDDGWTFETDDAGATGDTLFGLNLLRDIYLRADPHITSRVSVPVLWDKHRQTIVSNESPEIIRMFNSAFDGITGNTDDYWPVSLRDKIEIVNDRVYSQLNNGVYRCGFAPNQTAYDTAVVALFDTLDWLEDILAHNRYLTGDRITEADWRLFTTLLRFDAVYHTHFKCNLRRLRDYPNLWGFARELYQWNGVADTVNFDHILRHYYRSHESINPRRIIPINPVINWDEPHNRD